MRNFRRYRKQCVSLERKVYLVDFGSIDRTILLFKYGDMNEPSGQQNTRNSAYSAPYSKPCGSFPP
jgi:hypothetical protein